MTEKSPYLGVKYHIEIDFPHDLIALHIFKNGYCGLSKVEGNAYCLCYLTLRDNLKNHANIGEMESNVLSKNPFLKDIFKKAKFLYDKPEVINEISFAKKTCIEKGIPMAGDAVGMISPLCGNGMAIAIHSAKILGEIILKNWDKKNRIPIIESHYQQQWKSLFQKRIWAGRKIQDIFGNELLTNTSIFLLKQMKPVAKYLIQQTHGKKI